jgi:hypothetical protein
MGQAELDRPSSIEHPSTARRGLAYWPSSSGEFLM